MTLTPFASSKTAVVLGAAYAGFNAVQTLLSTLPPTWRLVVVDKHTHFHHLYAFPRVSVLKGHEQKVFIPLTTLFKPVDGSTVTVGQAELWHAEVLSLHGPGNATRSLSQGKGEVRVKMIGSGKEEALPYDFLIYALGSKLPASIDVASDVPTESSASDRDVIVADGSKAYGVAWICANQDRIQRASSVLVIGGGPLGIQFASDIADLYGTPTIEGRSGAADTSLGAGPKTVTLLSSSKHLLPRFDPWMHEEAAKRLKQLGVNVVTGARADLSTLKGGRVKTLTDFELEAELVLLCTGQTPNTSHLQSLSKDLALGQPVVNATNGMAFVNRHLQLAVERNDRVTATAEPETLDSAENIFVVGDAADAFGALNAGHTAYHQAKMAARNLARLVVRSDPLLIEITAAASSSAATGVDERKRSAFRSSFAALGDALEAYQAEPHAIKVSLGLAEAILQQGGECKAIESAQDDLGTPVMWDYWGLGNDYTK